MCQNDKDKVASLKNELRRCQEQVQDYREAVESLQGEGKMIASVRAENRRLKDSVNKLEEEKSTILLKLKEVAKKLNEVAQWQ